MSIINDNDEKEVIGLLFFHENHKKLRLTSQFVPDMVHATQHNSVLLHDLAIFFCQFAFLLKFNFIFFVKLLTIF